MANKVVGFTINIKGQNEIKTTTQLLGLLNTQLILLSNTVGSFDTNTVKLSKDLKKSFDTFKDGNKIVKDLGNGYFEVTKQIDKAAKEFGELDKVIETDSNSIKDLINRNKELKKILETAPRAGTEAFEEQKESIIKLTKEYGANNDAIKEFRKELRTGVKQSEAAEGSLDALRKRAIELKKEYNALSGSQQSVFSVQGRKIRKELLATQKRIQALDTAVKDGRTSIGLYAQEVQKGLVRGLLKLSVGRSVVDGLANGLRNAFNGLRELASGTPEAEKRFEDLNKAGGVLINSLNNIGNSFLKSFGGGITKVINSVSFAIDVVGNAFISASEGTGIFATALRFVGSIFTDFPSIVGGVIEVFREFRAIASNIGTEISLNFEKIGASLSKVKTFITGGDTREINARLEEINRQLEANVIFARGIGQAYTDGFNATQKAQDEFIKGAEKEVEAEKKRQEAIERREAQLDEAAKAEKKRNEELIKDRRALLQELNNFSNARIDLVKQLGEELSGIEIQLIQDSTQRALAEEKQKYQLEREQQLEAFDTALDDLIKQEAKIQALFGEGSAELIAFQKKSGQQFLQVQQSNNELLEAKARQHQENLNRIETEGEQARIDAEQKSFDDEIAETEAKYDELERIEGERSDALIAKQIEAQNQEDEQRQERNQATKDAAINLVNAAFEAISAIQQIAFDAENARFDAAIESRQQSISKLNKDLENATGLQKKFLEIQLKNEEDNLKKETEAKEEARKKQGEAQKAIAITQAIIAAALGIANAFSLPPPASFIAAAATAVATGAQIAVIASQKFAEGGLVGANAPANVGNGRISTGSNIARQSNGDNILATVKQGEVILNEKQQRLLGGYKTFASIGVPGFANGGITGPPISAPIVANNVTDVNTRFNQFIDASLAMTAATNRRIDRISVNLDLNNLEDVQGNDENLNALTTFG